MDHERPHRSPSSRDHEKYYDDSDDLVERVRRAKEAAQRKIEEFGDPSEYIVTKIYGRRTDIDYSKPPKEEEAPVAPASPEASTAPQEFSESDAQRDADRKTTVELGSDVPQREEQ